MSRDIRRYARETNLRLAVGGLFLIFIIGDGLIYLIYGSGPAGMGLLCLFVGLSPLVLIWLALTLLDWIVKRADS